MMTDSAAVVIFAIRSALRLGEQIRKSYIDATKRRDLVLPLPRFFQEIDTNDRAQWFHSGEGNEFLAQSDQLKEMIGRFGENQPLTDSDKAALKEFYTEFRTIFIARSGLPPADLDDVRHGFREEEIIAWVTVRQWTKGSDPNPTTLQRLAGTFIEIGVDYFANTPGALHPNSAWGKALQGFLRAMDGINFAEGKLEDLPGRLLVATLETVAANPELLTGDAKARELIQVTAESLSANVATRLAQIAAGDVQARNRVQDWAELTFRSVLASAGRLVLSKPERFLGVSDPAQSALIANVGDAVLDLVLDHPEQGLDKVFGREGIETVVRAALATLGEHPEILVDTKNEGLRTLLSEIARELSQFDTLLTPDLLPDLLQLVLAKTGENLDLLWPDLKKKPEANLLLTALKATLAAVTEPVEGSRWKLRFTRAHLLQISEAVLDELVTNPQWLFEKAGEQSETLEATLRAVVAVLAKRGDERISPQTGVLIIQAVIQAVVQRLEFLQRLPDEGQALITCILDTILAGLFNKRLDPNVAWQVIRSPVIQGMVETSLRLLGQTKLDPSVLAALKSALKEETKALAEGELFTIDSFEKRLTNVLVAR